MVVESQLLIFKIGLSCLSYYITSRLPSKSTVATLGDKLCFQMSQDVSKG